MNFLNVPSDVNHEDLETMVSNMKNKYGILDENQK